MNTRKKVIKTVYKDEDDSEAENGDFSDSGSEAVISQPSSSEDDGDTEIHNYSNNETNKKKQQKAKPLKNLRLIRTPKIVLPQSSNLIKDEYNSEPTFSIKDLTDADKLLPSILNLSESDSSDDEVPTTSSKSVSYTTSQPEEVEMETEIEYKDVWSKNLEQSEQIAQKTFLELEKHKTKLEETKQSIQKYSGTIGNTRECDVKDLLALGEEIPSTTPTKIRKNRVPRARNDSDSDVEDWEEVAERKTIPQQGLQLVVDFPDAVSRKKKKVDVEMMMKRKINRVKKEYQVYMHKVHVLCWIGHGNYISQVINDQDVMSAALSIIPSKECYPGERVDMKYVEQITTWFKDKINIKYDKNEGKFRPKAPSLKNILLEQIKHRVVTSKKYVVFIFVSMLRAVGLQCRIMLNFTTLPIKPPATELCSLSTKIKENVNIKGKENVKNKPCKRKISNESTSDKIPQLDGNYDSLSDSDFDNIMQVDGNNDISISKHNKSPKKEQIKVESKNVEGVSPPKRTRRNLSTKKDNPQESKNVSVTQANKSNSKIDKEEKDIINVSKKSLSLNRNRTETKNDSGSSKSEENITEGTSHTKKLSLRKTRSSKIIENPDIKLNDVNLKTIPNVVMTNNDTSANVASTFFNNEKFVENQRSARTRKRAHTSNPTKEESDTNQIDTKKSRAKSVPQSTLNKSKYFNDEKPDASVKLEKKIKPMLKKAQPKKTNPKEEDNSKRISHRDLKAKEKPKNDVTDVLVNIIKKRVREAKVEPKKGKNNKSSDEDSDYLPEATETQKSPSTQIAKATTSRKKDRRVLSTDDERPSHKMDTWCEIYVEELEQWIAVDIIKGRVHCVNEIYTGATHPVTYVVGWDNNNYLKDLTRRYVPHWNTVTRKQRVEPAWWDIALQPWKGPRTARDKEEDESLDRLQLDAPLPKSIAEYKNHPLYALKRHLLKFEAIYPPDAATLGFVRGEAVYARDCVYVCRSRDTWLKEAKVVRLGEQPYKVVKARPKWDRLSNKLITDKPLEVFGPWQVQDYEPPVAENGLVPRNAYGNVELFKDCMLPKGTVHIKLPGLNRVAKKLNIDCAPAMTGFDFNGGWSHPVYDGFIVCQEFEDIITNAWHEDQLEQERKEVEKLEARVYGNWRRLIKGLLIRERLKLKYGFSEPSTSQDAKKKSSGPRLIAKKKGI